MKWLGLALEEAGHEVLVLSLGTPPQLIDLKQHENFSGPGKIAVKFVDASDTNRRSSIGASRYLIHELRMFRPDCYIACGTGWNLFAPAILSRACGVLVFHEVMSGIAGNWKDSRWLTRWFFDCIIAQAYPVAENFKHTFTWSRKIAVLPAFPEPLEKTARLPPATQHIVPLQQARAAMFGRLEPHKQALWLVKQWPKLSKSLAELHIYGTGTEEQPIRELIIGKGWQRRVFCHGAYPNGQGYVDLLASFDLTLLPTIGAEGAPLVLLESLACGIPFITFDVGGIPDYANPDCEIVSVTSPGSFVKAVERAVKHLAEGTVDHARLQRFYLDVFSYECLKQKWLNFLSQYHSPRD